jgi:hypothetical protein
LALLEVQAMAESKFPSRWRVLSWSCVLASVGLSIWWHFHLPTVGKGGLILALAAVLMPLFWENVAVPEKMSWIAMLCILMSVEYRAIDKEHYDNAIAQQKALEAIGNGFTGVLNDQRNSFADLIKKSDEAFKKTTEQASAHFDATMNRSDRIIAGVGDTIKTETGGDSFAYITFTPEPGNVKFNQFPTALGPQFLASITSHGKYPLREIHATMMDDERRREAMEEYNKHPDGDWMRAIQSGDTRYQFPYLRPQSPEGPSGDVELLGVYPLPKKDSKRLSIAFSSLNGYWNETLHLGLVNGAWHQCLSVMGPTVKQATNPFIYCDSDWPEGRALAEKDWPRLKRPSPHR